MLRGQTLIGWNPGEKTVLTRLLMRTAQTFFFYKLHHGDLVSHGWIRGETQIETDPSSESAPEQLEESSERVRQTDRPI